MTDEIKRLESEIAAAKDTRQKIDAMNKLASILRESDLDKAICLCEETRAQSTNGEFFDSPYQKGLADSLKNLSVISKFKADYSAAISHAVEALSIYKLLNDIEGQIDIYSNLGDTDRHLGNYPEALNHFINGLRLSEDLQDLPRIATMIANIAIIYTKTGDPEKTLEFDQKALEIYIQVKDYRREAYIQNNLAVSYYSLEKYPEALHAAHRALTLAKELHLPHFRSTVLCTIGEIYLEQNDFAQAQTYFGESLELAQEIGHPYIELYTIFCIAKSRQKLDKNDEALDFYLQALELAEKIDEKHLIYEICQAISEIYKSQSDYENALEYFEKHYTLEKEMFNEKISAELDNLEKYYQSLEKQKGEKNEAEFRNLFEGSPIAVWEADGSQVKEIFNSLEESSTTNLDAYFDEHPEQLSHCYSLLKPTRASAKAVELYNAKDIDQLLNEYTPAIHADSFDAVKKFMVELYKGKLQLELLTTAISFTKEEFRAHNYISIAEEHKHDLKKIIISTLDVTEQKQKEEQLRQLTMTDPLTGISNRRHFFLMAADELQRSIRHQRDFSIILLDLDRFKKVNDTYGHIAGDVVLQQIANLCQDQLRINDQFARFGGEEFVVLLPETTMEAAEELAERLRKKIAKHTIKYDGKRIKVTISAGVTHFDHAVDMSIEDLIEQADIALYHSKEKGRNQVTVSSSI